MPMGLADWTEIWYQCLVCSRLFQFPDKLILHKTTTSCAEKYPPLERQDAQVGSSSDNSPSRQDNPIVIDISSESESECSVGTDLIKQPNLDVPISSTPTQVDNNEKSMQTNNSNGCSFSDCNSSSYRNINTHKPKNHLKCLQCGKTHKTFASSKLHKCAKCMECGEYFRTTFLLQRHVYAYHVENPIKCDVCDYGFSRKDSLMEHFKSLGHLQKLERKQKQNLIKTAAEESYKCAICVCEFPNASLFQQHLLGKPHANAFLKLQVRKLKIKRGANRPNHLYHTKRSVCRESSHDSYHGKAHFRTHFEAHNRIQDRMVESTRGEKRLEPFFPCDMCEKSYSQLGSLSKHRVIHTGRFECRTCNARYRCLYELTRHEKSSHHKRMSALNQFKPNYNRKENPKSGSPNTKQKLMKCGICQKKFASLQILSSHEAIHTRIQMESYCDICMIQYSGERQLWRHFDTNLHKLNLCLKQSVIND